MIISKKYAQKLVREGKAFMWERRQTKKVGLKNIIVKFML